MEKQPEGFVEQIIVSGSVLRQADKLPIEMVDQHKQILQGLGIVGESLQTFLDIPKPELLGLVDQLQKPRL